MKPTIGHAAMHYPPAIQQLHELTAGRSLRQPDSTGTQLRTIACNEEEFTAVCRYLAERRANSHQPHGAVPHREGK